MRKRDKRIILTVLVTIEMLICMAMLGLLVAARTQRPNVKVFYFATERAEERIEKRFAVDGPAKIDLDNTRGDVAIVGSDGDEIVVQAVAEAWGVTKREAQAKAQALAIKTRMEGSTLHVEVEDPEPEVYLVVGSTRASQVRFEVTVPRRTEVAARTRHSLIDLEGTEGDAELYSEYGNISVADVRGGLDVETNNGNVTVRRAGDETKEIDLRSRYGEIVAERVAGTIRVETSNGPVTVHSAGGANALLVVRNHYGSIEVEDVVGNIDVETNNGYISVQRSGGQEAAIRVSTRYDNITLREVEARELEIECGNGSLVIDQVTVEEDLTLDTQYVSIDADSVRAQSLKVTGRNGEISLANVELEGALDVRTEYGAVDVRSTEASAYRIEAQNESISLDGAHGLLQLESSYGGITVRNAYDAVLDLRARNAKIAFEGSLDLETKHRVESEYGDIELRLPSSTAVYLDASTQYGDIDCDFDVLVKGTGDEAERDTNEKTLRGPINEGEVELFVETRNGSITIESR